MDSTSKGDHMVVLFVLGVLIFFGIQWQFLTPLVKKVTEVVVNTYRAINTWWEENIDN